MKHAAPGAILRARGGIPGKAGYGNVFTMNTLKSGPVTGDGELVNPTGVGGVIPAIGKLIVPPANVPLTNGAPNSSCTLRTSYRLPTLRTLDRSTDTEACRLQL